MATADILPDPDSDAGNRPVGRSVGVAVAVGAGVALAVVAIVYAMIAIPFFTLARVAEPGQGLDRPFIRNGIVYVALPAGVLIGLASGTVAGLWYGRGGSLPRD